MDFCCKRIMIFNDAQKSVGWMLRAMVMAWWLGKKKKLSRVTDMNRPRTLQRLSQFSLSNTRMVVFVNSKNLPSLNETWSFYRELEVSLFAQIHYHHGRCVELMEKMERISGNPPHVMEWQIVVWLCKVCREFLWKLLSVVWSSIPLWAMDDHPWLFVPF